MESPALILQKVNIFDMCYAFHVTANILCKYTKQKQKFKIRVAETTWATPQNLKNTVSDQCFAAECIPPEPQKPKNSNVILSSANSCPASVAMAPVKRGRRGLICVGNRDRTDLSQHASSSFHSSTHGFQKKPDSIARPTSHEKN